MNEVCVETNVVLRNLSDGANIVNDIDLVDVNSATIFFNNKWVDKFDIYKTN